MNNFKTKNIYKSNLGKPFEDLINTANKIYLEKGIAAIYKKPTPVQVVKVEYPLRSKAKITEAYYRIPSTTDYNGIYRGKYIDFEAKSCSTDLFSFDRLYTHQIEHLQMVQKLKGISFLIIEFKLHNEIFIIPTKVLIKYYNEACNNGKKSISYKDCLKENLHIVNCELYLDYLSIIDQVFF